MNDYTHKKGLVYKNQFHVIWCPRRRKPILKNGIDERLRSILFEVAEEMDVNIKALEIMPDHVHIFIDFDPRIMLHKIIKQMKGRSSHILREEFPYLKKLPSVWTRNYFSCSVGHVSEETIIKYINEQKADLYTKY